MNNATIERFRRLDEASQLAELFALRDEPYTLRRLRDLYGIKECPVDCEPVRRPCVMHTTWRAQYLRGMTPREIARDWEDTHNVKTQSRTVKRYLARPRPDQCSCAPLFFLCPHLSEAQEECGLSDAVLLLLDRLIDPESYLGPPLGTGPALLSTCKRTRVRLMAARYPKFHIHYAGDVQRNMMSAYLSFAGAALGGT